MAEPSSIAARERDLVAPGFEEVAELFGRLLAERRGSGAAMCVYVDGAPVVDLCAGATYRHDTLTFLFSVSKGIAAICVALLVQEGRLDVDRPVAAYWPEFAAAGKERVTVGQLMSHRAGLPVLAADLPVAAWHDGRAAELLAAQAPLWKPDTLHGYHAWTYGVLLNALMRRVDGRSVGRFLAEEIAGPLGIDAWIGLPAELEARVAPLIVSDPPPQGPDNPVPVALQPLVDRMASGFHLHPDLPLEAYDDPELHRDELPAVNAFGSAHGLARLYASCVSEVDGRRLLSDDTIELVRETRSAGYDVLSREENRFGLGFQLPFARIPMAGEGSFGHDGFGGALAFAHPASRLAFAFTTDQLPARVGADAATQPLIAATLRCLGRRAASVHET